MCNVTLFRNTKMYIPSPNILFTQLAKTNDPYVETHASLMLDNKISRSGLRLSTNSFIFCCEICG